MASLASLPVRPATSCARSPSKGHPTETKSPLFISDQKLCPVSPAVVPMRHQLNGAPFTTLSRWEKATKGRSRRRRSSRQASTSVPAEV